ncbi:glycosyltransferase family 4 protein [candidate division WOR-3 bacterium]|nr:glycosyltransferase family 4 protein [candidate division WOR-3 bacterium]
MRIAIVAHNIVKEGDGQGKANYKLAQWLIEQGHKVYLYVNKVEPSLKGTAIIHRIRVPKRPLILKIPLFLIFATLKLLYKKYNIIHINSGTYFGHYNFLTCHFCHTAFLSYETGIYHKVYTLFNSWIERLIFKRSGKIITVSYRLKKELINLLGVLPERILVMPNGVDTNKFKPLRGKSRGEPQVRKFKDRCQSRFKATEESPKVTKGELILPTIKLLFIGENSIRKGLDFLIKAMQGIDKDITLLIAGRKKHKYEKLAKGLQVKFLDFCKNNAELYHNADIFILPSLYDPFGIVVLEAMASGIPVLVSELAGVSELIQDGENGILINNPRNIDELRSKILLLAKDEELRSRLSIKGIKTANRYTWSKILDQKGNLYYESLNSKSFVHY